MKILAGEIPKDLFIQKSKKGGAKMKNPKGIQLSPTVARGIELMEMFGTEVEVVDRRTLYVVPPRDSNRAFRVGCLVAHLDGGREEGPILLDGKLHFIIGLAG